MRASAADGEPKLAVKRWLMAAHRRNSCCQGGRPSSEGGVGGECGAAAAKIGGEADAGSELRNLASERELAAVTVTVTVTVARPGETKGCGSEAGLELKQMLVLKQLLVCGQATSQKSED